MRTEIITVVIRAGNVILVDDPPLLEPVVVVEEPLPLGAPDPPATLESCANPTEPGLPARKTEYTFFKKESPTTQEGLPEPEGMLLPRLRSKIAPRHCELPRETWPIFMSAALIGQALPPKESVTSTEVEQGKEKNPCWSATATEPGTAAQMALTSAVGPPIRVVPVSMAARAALPVEI